MIQWELFQTIDFFEQDSQFQWCNMQRLKFIELVFFFLNFKQDMKIQNHLWSKYGETLDEKSLTICSGTDYINVNYQHIVCPDAETAKVSFM